MTSLFEQLDPVIQERMLTASGANASSISIMERHQRVDQMKQGDRAILCACLASDREAIRALLDLGVPINPDISLGYPSSPLAMSVHNLRLEKFPAKRLLTLSIIDELLERGANPNAKIFAHLKGSSYSAMHEALSQPQALERLLAWGGDVHALTDRGSLLDDWLNHASQTSPASLPGFVHSLSLLAKAGMDLNGALRVGGCFLVKCWGSSGLRPHVSRFVAEGADPHHKGPNSAEKSLWDLLTDKVDKAYSGSDKAVALETLSDLQAIALAKSTPAAAASPSRPRL